MVAVIGELALMALLGTFSSGVSPSAVIVGPTYSILPVPEPPHYVNPVTQAPSPEPLFLSLETGAPVVQTVSERLAFYEPAIMANQEQALIQAQSSYEYYSSQNVLSAREYADFAYVKAVLARLGY